jgi:hypothetical protein
MRNGPMLFAVDKNRTRFTSVSQMSDSRCAPEELRRIVSRNLGQYSCCPISFRWHSVGFSPLSVPVQTFSIRNTGTRFDVHTAQNLLHSSFNPVDR